MRSRILIFILLLAALVISRVPFAGQMLLGEEGSFAALVASPVPSSAVTPNKLPQMLIGSIGGEAIYYPFQRNITPYLLIERTAGSALRALDVHEAAPQRMTVAVRLAYFAFFVLGTAGLLWIATKSWLSIALVIFTLSTPLAVGASIQPQIDGSTGVALVGLSCLLLLGSSPLHQGLSFVVAGFLIGLGRHELALAFGAAAFATLALQWILRISSRQRIVLFCIGLGLGVVAAILISPTDYAMGYATMNRVYSAHLSRLNALWTQAQFVWPVWLLIAATLAALGWRLRTLLSDHPEIVVVALGATAIALGFAISGWSGDGFPRYYAPALVAIAYGLVALRQRVPPVSKPLATAVLVGCLVGVASNAVTLTKTWQSGTSITSMPGVPLAAMTNKLADTAAKTRAAGTIALEQASLWAYYPGVDFIGLDVGAVGARQLLEERYPTQVSRFRE